MPNLGDYLGVLMAEIIIARAQADLETIRTAELYASHPHLKHFPVPHLRLPTVTLDVAYAVDKSEEVPAKGSPRGNIDPAAMRKAFREQVSQVLTRRGLKLEKQAAAQVDDAVARVADGLTTPAGGAVALMAAAAGFADATVAAIAQAAPETVKDPKAAGLAQELKQAGFTAFLPLRELPPRLSVLVTKKDLMEMKNPDLLSRVRLTISEEGQEWTVIESEGKSNDRLVPE